MKEKKLRPIRLTDEDEKMIVRRISLVSIAGNVVLSGFKLFAGIFGHSGAMISDAVHSLSDVLTTFIAVIGVKMAKRGADKEHPYGHERLETIASMLLGLILAVTGLGIGKVSLDQIMAGSGSGVTPPTLLALAAALGSILTKEAMYWYTRHYAKLLNSSAFMADAWHHRSDAFSSIGSLIGIGGAMLGFPVMDSIASIVICLFILKVSYDIIKDAVAKILDTSCGDEFENKLRDFITQEHSDVRIDMLQTRAFGSKIYVDLEIAVNGNLNVSAAHDIAEAIHASVEQEFADVKHVMIHVNPIESDESSER